MEGKRGPTLSELRVGIFVVATCIVLAVAIFTIGSQYGLLEKTFKAKTYLNNVSGLKPGDLVLLGGVEVGNITKVRIANEDEIPDIESRQRTQRELDDLEQQLVQLRGAAPSPGQMSQLQSAFDAAVTQYGPESRQARIARGSLASAQRRLRAIDNLEDEIERVKEGIQNIEVEMQVGSSYRDWIKRDSSISLGSIGLLGDKFIEISLGRTEDPPRVESQEVDSWFGTRTEQVVVITGEQQAGFQELITGANDILVNFETLSEKLVDVIDQLQQGEGSIGKFISDDALYNNLNNTVKSAQTAAEQAAQMLRNINQGEGSIPKLIREPELYDRINSTVGSLDQAIAKVNSGEGTLGKLINDRSIYDKSDQMLGNVEQVTRRMANGEGTLGKLSTDEQLYVDLREAVDQLGKFMADVEAGKGTLGRLAKDEQLYQNVNELSSEVVKLIYDFRQNPKKFLTIKFELF